MTRCSRPQQMQQKPLLLLSWGPAQQAGSSITSISSTNTACPYPTSSLGPQQQQAAAARQRSRSLWVQLRWQSVS